MKEQMNRENMRGIRFKKYTDVIYTQLLLQSFGRSILHPQQNVVVFFDVDKEDLASLSKQLLSVTSDGYEEFVRIQLFGFSEDSLVSEQPTISDRYRAFLCGRQLANPVAYQLCVLEEKAEDVPNAMRRCSERVGESLPALLECYYSDVPAQLLQNMTQIAENVVRGDSIEEAMLDLAAMDDEDLGDLEDAEVEVEIDTEAELMSAKSMEVIRSLMPRTVMLNGKRLDVVSLRQTVCDMDFDTKPLICTHTKPVPFTARPSSALREPVLTVHINTNCNSNVKALDEVMTWLGRHEECVLSSRLICSLLQTVSFVLTPFTDILIDRTADHEYQLRTPRDHHHIARSFVIACAVRSTMRPSVYWPFVRCMLRCVVCVACEV